MKIKFSTISKDGVVIAISDRDLATALQVRHQEIAAQVRRFGLRQFAIIENDQYFFTKDGCENIALSFDNRQIWKNWEKNIKPLFPDDELTDLP